MIKLLVIIVTYNGMKWIDRCIESVIKSTINGDLFIIDNGSTDGTVKHIELNYPSVILIQSSKNVGFGRANNIGFKFALDNGYNYVYLLNQDAWVEPDVFNRLISILRTNSDFGLLSPLQLNGSLSGLDKNFLAQCPRAMLSDFICSNLFSVYEAEFVMAAHWMLPIATIKSVGGFSPTFKHYGEDGDYINRIKYIGKKVGIVPKCRAIHDREFRQLDKKGKQYKFYTDNLVMLSNPNINKRYIRLLNSYLQNIFKDKEVINLKFLVKTIKNLFLISKNKKISQKGFAFLN